MRIAPFGACLVPPSRSCLTQPGGSLSYADIFGRDSRSGRRVEDLHFLSVCRKSTVVSQYFQSSANNQASKQADDASSDHHPFGGMP